MNEKEISPVVRELAGKINVTIDERGVGKGDETSYVDNLPEGLERHKAFEKLRKQVNKIVNDENLTTAVVDTVKEHSADIVRAKHGYDTDFFAAFALSLGESAQSYIAEHKDVNRVIGSVKELDRNKFNGTYDHTYNKQTFPTADKPATVEKAYGRVQVSFDQVGNRKTASQLISVRQELAQKAAQGLSD